MSRKIATVFPGQGCQYVGMGKFLYDNFTQAKQIFEEANNALGYDIKKVCFEGDLEALTLTENAQTAILTVGYASFCIYQNELEFQPQFMAGHSLGEYTALTCAGGMKFSDAIKIVHKRGEFMQEAATLGTGIMAAVNNISPDIVKEMCDTNNSGEVVIANYNEPLQTVISGYAKDVEKIAQALKKKGADIIYLNVSAPFHSPLMKIPAEKLNRELSKYTFHKLKFPVISNVDVNIYKSENEIIDNLTRQMTSPVRWSETMQFLVREGVEIVIDTGPKTIARNLARKNSYKFLTYSLDNPDDRTKLRKQLSEQNIAFIEKALAIAVSEKNRNWNNNEYEKGVIIPYNEVKQLYFDKMGKNIFFNSKDVKKAMTMLQTVFDTKKLPEDEKKDRFNQLINETGLWHFFPKLRSKIINESS